MESLCQRSLCGGTAVYFIKTIEKTDMRLGISVKKRRYINLWDYINLRKGTSINYFIEILRFMLSRFLCERREHSELRDRQTIKNIQAENQNIIKVPIVVIMYGLIPNGYL